MSVGESGNPAVGALILNDRRDDLASADCHS